MTDKRVKQAKYNIYISLLGMIVSTVIGLILPRLFMSEYGSEVYGATNSIAQFLGFITILEGGVGGVARAAFYKPLAEKDVDKASEIMTEIKRFFRIIGFIFGIYVVILAFGFQKIAHIETLDWISTFWLVIAISISGFVQYFIGISNKLFMQASQKQYISETIGISLNVVQTVLAVFLIHVGCSIITVKLFTGVIGTLGPILLWLYVKKNFGLKKTARNKNALENKWTGMGQHLAFFLHNQTDVAVLTLLGNLLLVAVYSVYAMAINAIQKVVLSFSTGMEALFGDMYAKKEYELLNKSFGEYETLISSITTVMFSAVIVLVTPFVKIYTSGITDADYFQPLFGIILAIASVLYCLRAPYHNMIIAAGHFKESRWASYGEAVINVVLSILLVIKFGLVGVAIGTVCATAFRFIFYVFYLSKNILCRSVGLWLKRIGVNAGVMIITILLSKLATSQIEMENYLYWALSGVITVGIAVGTTLIANFCFYKNDTLSVLKHIASR